jgi:hypothetical protein
MWTVNRIPQRSLTYRKSKSKSHICQLMWLLIGQVVANEFEMVDLNMIMLYYMAY